MITGNVSGNLGKDAETKGEATHFSIASNEKVKGEKVTTWVNCTLWGKRGEALRQYLTKGSKVCASGTVRLREYESQGQKKQSLDLMVDQIELMGGGEKKEGATKSDDESMPF